MVYICLPPLSALVSSFVEFTTEQTPHDKVYRTYSTFAVMLKRLHYKTNSYHTVLYRTMLYCIVPCCTVSYHTVLYLTILYCIVPYFTVLNHTILYCIVPYCTKPYHTVLYHTVLYHSVLYYTSVSPSIITTGRSARFEFSSYAIITIIIIIWMRPAIVRAHAQ